MIIRRVLPFLAAALATASLATGASATLLAPGGFANDPPTNLAVAFRPGTFITSATAQFSSTPGGLFSGTIYQEVYQNTAGTFDFYYQFHNDATYQNYTLNPLLDLFNGQANKNSIDRLTLDGFDAVSAGTLINVGYLSGTLGSFGAPTSGPLQHVDRPVPDGVGFGNFGSAWVAPNQTSEILVVQTNATDVLLAGNASFIDTGVASTAPLWRPQGLAAVPEPAFFQLAALFGLSGIGLLRVRRRAKSQLA